MPHAIRIVRLQVNILINPLIFSSAIPDKHMVCGARGELDYFGRTFFDHMLAPL